MTPVPSRRLLTVLAALAVAAFALLVFPAAWPLLVAANAAALLAALLDLVVSPRRSLVRAERLAPERMAVRAAAHVAVVVRNRSRQWLRVKVRESVPAGFRDGETETELLVRPNAAERWEYSVTPRSRGRYEWGPLSLRYRSTFGLWELPATEPAEGESRVYPNLSQLERYHLLARSDRLAALGIRRVRFRGGSTEFESLREYAPGDDVRQLDWMATARRARLTVRHREAERNQTVILFVDCGRLMNATENGTSKLDFAVDAALLLAHVALARGDRVGLCTFSGTVHAWLPPRGNLAQNRLIAESLYALAGDFTETDHARALKFVTARYPKRSLLVTLTDFVDATTAADMVAHLQLAARRHVVLFAALKDAFLVKAAADVPKSAREGFRKAAAVGLLRERAEVLEQIRHAGGLVVDAEPDGVTPPLVNGYLEVMLGGKL
ncbi:MAG: DUF58 domain-containing protein [Gemmataceae bacterium]